MDRRRGAHKMKTITRNKRPDELPFTFELIDVSGARINVWSSTETIQLLIDIWVKEGAYIRTTPNNRIELTVTEEVGLVRIKPPTDTPGEGWRFLETGEFFKRGDEFLGFDGLWAEVFKVDVRYDPQYHYKTRRRIKPPVEIPGEGWRLLDEGEIFEDGDEYLNSSEEWRPTLGRRGKYDSKCHRKIRRRIKPTLRIMRPDEFPPKWWFKVSDDWYSTVFMSDKGFQNICMYQAWNDVDFYDKWSDRPFGTEKSFFVEDVK